MSSNLQLLKDVFELLSYIAVLFGIPIALFQYIQGQKAEKSDRLFNTFNTVDEKYLDFLKICIEYPCLDIFDIPDSGTTQLKEDQKKQEQIAFTMPISIFELAFITYQDHSQRIREQQWSAWERDIKSYCLRSNFQDAWENNSYGYTHEFRSYINSLIRHAKMTQCNQAQLIKHSE